MKENGCSTFVPSIGLRHALSPGTPSFPRIAPDFQLRHYGRLWNRLLVRLPDY